MLLVCVSLLSKQRRRSTAEATFRRTSRDEGEETRCERLATKKNRVREEMRIKRVKKCSPPSLHSFRMVARQARPPHQAYLRRHGRRQNRGSMHYSREHHRRSDEAARAHTLSSPAAMYKVLMLSGGSRAGETVARCVLLSRVSVGASTRCIALYSKRCQEASHRVRNASDYKLFISGVFATADSTTNLPKTFPPTSNVCTGRKQRGGGRADS